MSKNLNTLLIKLEFSACSLKSSLLMFLGAQPLKLRPIALKSTLEIPQWNVKYQSGSGSVCQNGSECLTVHKRFWYWRFNLEHLGLAFRLRQAEKILLKVAAESATQFFAYSLIPGLWLISLGTEEHGRTASSPRETGSSRDSLPDAAVVTAADVNRMFSYCTFVSGFKNLADVTASSHLQFFPHVSYGRSFTFFTGK